MKGTIINKERIITFLIGSAIIALFVILHFKNPQLVHTSHIIIIIVIWLIILFSLRSEQQNFTFRFKSNVHKLLEQGICPFCEKNMIGDSKIRIGYSKARFGLAHRVIWVEVSYNRDELITSVPICDNCKSRFLQNKLANPSYFILDHQSGYSVGLKNPYDKSNIFKPERES